MNFFREDFHERKRVVNVETTCASFSLLKTLLFPNFIKPNDALTSNRETTFQNLLHLMTFLSSNFHALVFGGFSIVQNTSSIRRSLRDEKSLVGIHVIGAVSLFAFGDASKLK